MTKHFIAFILLIFIGNGSLFANSQTKLEPLPKHSLSTILITKLIDQYHYRENHLNDSQSSIIFDEYIEALDPGKNIFTQNDIDRFEQYRSALDNALIKGNLDPAFDIFRVYAQRRIERAEYALKRLEEKFDFSIKDSYLFDRENEGWANNTKALDDIWQKRVKNDYLTLLLDDKTDDEVKERLQKRYKRLIKRSNQFKVEDVYESFINAYLRSLEPHTAYFSPRTSENFNINMSLSLEGIGAVLQIIDEHTVVKRIVKGGPADLSNLIHAGDKIIGVGQGSGKVDDIVGWRLDDVVARIRGPKDTIVQLHILPEDSGLGGADKYISIVRNKIKLEDQQVQKSILEIPDGEETRRIGIIEIPAFYLDFAGSARGDKDFSSTTRDTRKIIDELNAEKVDGIVVDLRRNGGGSLVEAVSLTGLFIKQGPVVQIREGSGKIQINRDEDADIAYDGPLVVLVDRHSASASEIFAGAIQDYGRGIIVGEPTFGKGTVQTIIDLNRYVKGNKNTFGKLKITMAQFFRVNGDSTQHRGVVPDIIYPTSIKSDDLGERSLENALPWARIDAASFHSSKHYPVNLSDVETLHKNRVKKDMGFNFLLAQSKLTRDVIDKKEISLLQSERKTEREQRKINRNERLNQFRQSRGMKQLSLSEDVAKNEDENKNLSEEVNKIQLREAANILVDISRMSMFNKLSQIGVSLH